MAPARCASYVPHSGERLIEITWRLDHPLPSEVFTVIAVFRAGSITGTRGGAVAAAAGAMAVQHRRQWDAEDQSRSIAASAEAIVENKRLIDRLNGSAGCARCPG